jgi:hypothetical protein
VQGLKVESFKDKAAAPQIRQKEEIMKKRTVAVLKWAGLAVIVLGIIYAALHIEASHALKNEYAALRAAGRPPVWSLIDTSYPLPPTENSAGLYDAAVQLLQSEPPIPLAGYAKPNAWDDERASVFGLTGLLWQLGNVASKTVEVPPYQAATAQLSQLLKNPVVSEAMAIFERATARRGYTRLTEYSREADAYYPTQLDKRRFQFGVLAIIQFAIARQQAAEDNHETAWRTAIANLRFANALKDDLIYRPIQARLAMSGIRTVAARNAPSNARYEEIASLLAGFEDTTPLVRSLDAERLLVEDRVWKQSFLNLRREFHLGQQEPRFLIWFYEICPAFGLRDHAAYLQIMRALAENAAKPGLPGDSVVLTQQLLKNVPRYYLKTRNLIPSDPAMLRKINRMIPYMTMIAAARVTRAGLAALRYHSEKGIYPPDLQSMNLGALLDPFTGKPLIYRSTPSGFTVYSVGENGMDDGGAKSDKADRNLGLIIPGIRKVEYDDINPDIVWSHND